MYAYIHTLHTCVHAYMHACMARMSAIGNNQFITIMAK